MTIHMLCYHVSLGRRNCIWQTPIVHWQCVCACTTSEVYSEREEVRLGRETGLQIFVLSTSLKGALLGFCYA